MADRLVRFQIDLFVLDAAPHPFDEHVVAPASLAVHRQPDVPAQYGLGEGVRREYLSIRYTERLADAGVQPSAGSVGDSYDNALAETINGLYKAEVVHRRSWRTLQDVELATLEWVHWYNHRRLLGRLGYVSPAEAEEAYNRNLALVARAA